MFFHPAGTSALSNHHHTTNHHHDHHQPPEDFRAPLAHMQPYRYEHSHAYEPPAIRSSVTIAQRHLQQQPPLKVRIPTDATDVAAITHQKADAYADDANDETNQQQSIKQRIVNTLPLIKNDQKSITASRHEHQLPRVVSDADDIRRGRQQQQQQPLSHHATLPSPSATSQQFAPVTKNANNADNVGPDIAHGWPLHNDALEGGGDKEFHPVDVMVPPPMLAVQSPLRSYRPRRQIRDLFDSVTSPTAAVSSMSTAESVVQRPPTMEPNAAATSNRMSSSGDVAHGSLVATATAAVASTVAATAAHWSHRQATNSDNSDGSSSSSSRPIPMPTPLTMPQHRSAGGSSTSDDDAGDDDADDANDAGDDVRWDLRRLSAQRTIDSDSVDTAAAAFQRY